MGLVIDDQLDEAFPATESNCRAADVIRTWRYRGSRVAIIAVRIGKSGNTSQVGSDLGPRVSVEHEEDALVAKDAREQSELNEHVVANSEAILSSRDHFIVTREDEERKIELRGLH